VPLQETIKVFQQSLNGEHDHLPEEVVQKVLFAQEKEAIT
jgi:F0F1-type ATP synthase beta subunit